MQCNGLSTVIGGAPTATGGGTAYTYAWSNSGSLSSGTIANPTSSAIITTAYVVTVTDNNTCSAIASTTVTVNPLPVASAGGPFVQCNGLSTVIGGAPTAASGGTSYTYAWSNAASLSSGTIANPTSSAVVATTYTVTVTDNNGCSAVDVTTVTVNSLPIVSAGTDQSICTGGSATIGGAPTASGGGTSYTYLWNNGASLSSTIIANPSANPIINTTYTVTVTDNNGCSGIDVVSVSVGAVPIVDAGLNQPICTSLSTTIGGAPTATGAITPYTYSWSNGGSLSSTSISNPIASPTVTTNYSITVTDFAGCSAISAVTITVNPLPIANAGPVSAICTGGGIGIGGSPTATAGTSPYTYAWDNAATLNSTSIANPTASPLVNTIYSLTVTDINGCVSLSATTVSVGAIPVVDAGAALTMCPGTTSILGGSPTASGGATPYTYSWSNGGSLSNSTIANPVSNATLTTNYFVTVTDNGTCSAIASISVSVNPAPIANAGANQTICSASSPVLGGSPTGSAGTSPYTYNWDNAAVLDNATLANPTASITITTVFNLTLTDFNGCLATSSVSISVNQSPIADAGPTQAICSGGSVQIGASPAATGGQSPYVFAWSNGATLDNAAIANPNATPLINTVYTLTITDVNACTAVSAVTITVGSIPVVDAGVNQTICIGSSTIIGGSPTGSGGVTPYTYVWSNAGLLDDNTLANPNATPVVQTTYTVTVTDFGSCSAIASVTISLNTLPIADAGADQVFCTGGGVQIGGSPTASGGGGSAFTYLWDNPASLDDNTASNPNATPLVNTTYTVTITDNLGCTDTDAVIVSVTLPPTVDAGFDVLLCSGNSNVLGGAPTSSGGISPYIYSWSNGASLDNNTIANPTANPVINTTYTLTVTDNIGCVVTDAVIIGVDPLPTISAGIDDTICADNMVYTLAASTTVATGVFWSTTNGGGSFDNPSLYGATYTGVDADTTQGFVTFVANSVGNGACPAVSDTMVLVVNPAPYLESMNDTIVCPVLTAFPIDVVVHHSTSGVWSTSGTGVIGSVNNYATTYTPTIADTLAGSVTLYFSTTGSGLCNEIIDSLSVTFSPLPTVFAGNDTTICNDVFVMPVNGTVGLVTNGVWTTTGTGTFDDANSISTNYNLTLADIVNGGVSLVLTTVGGCINFSDTLDIIIIPSVNAGNDTIVCIGTTAIPVNGSMNGAGGVFWTTGGDGSFADPTALVTTYTFGANDLLVGTFKLILISTGNGVCPLAIDSMYVTVLAPASATASSDTTVCKSQLTIDYSGTITSAAGGVWSSSGTGLFTPDDSLLNVTYNITPADTALDSVIVYFATYGGCTLDSSILTINWFPPVLVDAGIDQNLCADATTVSISGTVTNATGGSWTTLGSGSFVDANALATDYIPSSGDTANGMVTLVLTSTGNGQCLAITDTLEIILQPLPTVFIGNDFIVCASVPQINLTGLVTNASGGIWSTLGSGTFDNVNLLSTFYVPSSADTAFGSVELILTSVGNGFCNPVDDSLLITFSSAAIVYAGADQTGCADINGILISDATAFNISSISWSTFGSGTFTPDSLSIPTSYLPSDADTTAGTVTIQLIGFGNSTCANDTDLLVISLVPGPIPDAGPDVTVCADSTYIELTGSRTTATSSVWTTNGNGTFVDASNLLTNYNIDPLDSIAGQITIYLTTSNAMCPDRTDSLILTILPAPIAGAGTDIIVCANIDTVQISGSIGNATGGIWSTLGTGTFVDNTLLSTGYLPSSIDTAAGSVNLLLTSTGNQGCNARTDTVLITFIDAPLSFAGNDTIICTDSVQLVAVLLGGSPRWTTLGDGYFFPNDSTLGAWYVFGVNDNINGSVDLVLTTQAYTGCSNVEDTVNVSLAPPLTITSVVEDSICAIIDSISFSFFSSTGAAVWTSLGNGSFFPTDSAVTGYYLPDSTEVANGFISIVVSTRNNNGCAPATDTAMVEVISLPSPGFINSLACLGDSVQFTDTSSGVLPIIGWQWEFDNGNTANIQNPSTVFNIDTTYNVSLIITDQFGCVDTVVTPVIPNKDPLASFTSTAACFVDSAYFFDTSTIIGDSIASWYWTFGDGGVDSLQNPGHVYAGPGIYNITFAVTATNGCSDSTSLTVSVNPGPTAYFTNSVPCFTDTTFFIDSSYIANGSIVSWDWDFGDGNTSSQQNPDNIFTTDTTQYVTLIVTSDSGCVDTVTQPVILNPLPTANFDWLGECLSTGVSFNDISTSQDTIVTWDWYFGDGFDSDRINPSHFYTTGGNYAVSLEITTSNGCTNEITQMITQVQDPIAGFEANPLLVYLFDDVTFTDQSTYTTSWNWNFGDGEGTSSFTSPVYAYQDSGSFVVILTAINETGCIDTAMQEIIVQQPPNTPTGFSPDGDGNNDVLYVLGGPYKKLDFRIYNNWGELIFISNDQTIGWDGRKHGVDQPLGVYVFTLSVTTENDIEYKNMHGDVTLLR